MICSLKLKVFLHLQEDIQDLSMLRHLNTINIRVLNPKQAYSRHSAELAEWLGWAKKILSRGVPNSEDHQEPKKVIIYFEGVPQTHFVGPP
jgi:hypothetical protein